MKVLKTNNQVILANNNAIVGEQDVVEEKDINFYDYDGTLLYSWTLDELPNKTELPPNPTHEGLTAQGWNWTLQDLLDNNDVADVGQCYETDDGKTRLYIYFPSWCTSLNRQVNINFKQNLSNGVEIDWGDGTAVETISGTGVVTTTHTYATNGNYIVVLNILENCTLTFYDNPILNDGKAYWYFLEKAEIGNNINIEPGGRVFASTSLKTINFNANIVYSGRDIFRGIASKLQCVIMPRGTIRFGSVAGSGYSNEYSIKVISLPYTTKEIGWYAFSGNPPSLTRFNLKNITYIASRGINGLNNVNFLNLSSVEGTISYVTGYTYLQKIILGENITTATNDFLVNCTNLKEIHFKGITPFTISSASSFRNLPTTCIIYVPTGSLTAYTTATNYPSSSTYTYVEE